MSPVDPKLSTVCSEGNLRIKSVKWQQLKLFQTVTQLSLHITKQSCEFKVAQEHSNDNGDTFRGSSWRFINIKTTTIVIIIIIIGTLCCNVTYFDPDHVTSER